MASSDLSGAVHPRLHGGADGSDVAAVAQKGPSPSARGSPGEPVFSLANPRSIPVCTGEPLKTHHEARKGGVHPRLHGGAPVPSSRRGGAAGPSPSARGSLGGAELRDGRQGSIPVCTGEPPCPLRRADARRVHPRLHGGASEARNCSTGGRGPSPSARGSPIDGTVEPGHDRSIPVCTGEPHRRRRQGAQVPVHPRLHGGACRRRHSPRHLAGPSPSARGSRRERAAARRP